MVEERLGGQGEGEKEVRNRDTRLERTSNFSEYILVFQCSENSKRGWDIILQRAKNNQIGMSNAPP
jgi:hypothetical protein